MLWTPFLGSDKGPWSQVLEFSCESCKNFMTTIFTKYLWGTASERRNRKEERGDLQKSLYGQFPKTPYKALQYSFLLGYRQSNPIEVIN